MDSAPRADIGSVAPGAHPPGLAALRGEILERQVRRVQRALTYLGAPLIIVGVCLVGADAARGDFAEALVGASLLATAGFLCVLVWHACDRIRQPVAAAVRDQAELAQAVDRLQQVDRAKTEFLNMTAHEFSAPLTPIRIQLHLLRKTEPHRLTEAQRASLQMIERNFARLALLAGDLLDVTRLQAQKLRVDPAPTSLGQLVAEAVGAHRALADQAGVRLSAQLDDTILAVVDPKRLSQAIDNLLANALKFTPPGGQVHVTLEQEGESAVLRVRDDGIGLSHEDREALFRPFSQGQKTRNGTGLGLYICRGIVEAHNGRIWAESPGRGRGATFAFSMPLATVPGASSMRAAVPVRVA